LGRQSAEEALMNAKAIVLIGYSMPPTDAYTRSRLLHALRNNVRVKRGDGLHIYTVMGANVGDAASIRLKGLFEWIPGITVLQQPMYGEDFLDVFERGRLLEGKPKG
jgi:hypothetical protein